MADSNIVFLHICLFAVAPILTYYWYFFIRNLVVSGEAAVNKSNIVLLVPVIAGIVLTLLSPVYNYVFYIDSSNVYHRGPLYNTYTAITYFYIVYGFIMVVMNRRRIVKQDFVPLFIFSVLPIIGGLVQTLFYGTLLMWSGTAYSLVIVYIFLQQRMVHLDALTGAWNRSSFDYYISQRINQENNDKLGFIYFDIDGLKNINDSYGHVEGDLAIKTAIGIIKKAIRKSDIIVRMGGDEFLIILDCESNADLEKTINRINEAFSEHNKISGKSYKLECSFGADIFNSEYSSIDQFLRHVDNLMYENKRDKLAWSICFGRK